MQNYHNQKQILQALGMEGLEWSSTTDLKMALILIGKSTGQLTYGCPFCDMAKPFTVKDYSLNTLGLFQELYKNYVEARSESNS